jgi:phage head maturation protease
MQDVIRKTTAGEFIKRTGNLFKYRLCSPRVDAYDDIVEPRGLDLTDFDGNPITLVGHDHGFIAGKWLNRRIESDGCLYADLQLAPAVSPRMREVVALVENNILSACSIGFVPIESKPRAGSTRGGQHYTRGILKEASLCAVGANPDALRVAKSLGVSGATIRQIWRQATNNNPTLSERIARSREITARARKVLAGGVQPKPKLLTVSEETRARVARAKEVRARAREILGRPDPAPVKRFAGHDITVRWRGIEVVVKKGPYGW